MALPLIAKTDAGEFSGVMREGDRVMERVRIAVRLTLIAAMLIPSLILHFIWRALRLSSPWPRRFLGTCARIVGARVERQGEPLPGDVVYVANHVSWIDILAIAGASGSVFIAKAEIRNAPVVGWLSTLNQTIFVSREDRSGVAAQVARLRDAIAGGAPVTIFPEGTTTDGRSLLAFKSSLLQMLDPAPPGVRVQSVVLDYSRTGPEIAWVGTESGAANAWRVLARRGSFPLKIDFLEAFDPAEYAGRKGIAAEARRRISDALAASLGHPTPEFIGHEAWGNDAPRRHKSGLATAEPAL